MKITGWMLLAWAGLIAQPGQGATLRWEASSGEARLKAGQFQAADTVFEGTPYVPIATIDSLLSLAGQLTQAGQWVPDRQKWVAKDKKNRTWVFSLDNAFCAVGDQILNLTYPIRRSADAVFIPLYPLLRILKLEWQWDITVEELPPTSGPTAVAGVRTHPGNSRSPPELGPISCEARGNGTLVTLGYSGGVDPEILWVPPNYLVRFADVTLSPEVKPREDGQGLVKTMLWTSDKNQVQLTLQLKGDYDTVELAMNEERSEMQFLVRKSLAKKSEPLAQPKKKNKNRQGTVILDAGHGGKDQGASVGDVVESRITLAVTLLLRDELKKMGYIPLLTRDKDEFISLADRPKFAAEKGGDLFLSLHCNSIGGSKKKKQQVAGFTAYILRAGASEEDNALARRENAAILEEKGKADKTEISPVDWILLEHQLNLYSKESEELAESIVTAFDGFDIQKYSTGAGQAGFFVLVGAYMPAVLFEMGFLTHDGDRAFMSSPKGQKRIAKQLAKAIDQFLSRQEDG